MTDLLMKPSSTLDSDHNKKANIGDTIVLYESIDNVPIYKTFEAYKKSGDALVKGDFEDTHKELIDSGDKFYVKSGTKARILDIKVFSETYQIRILDGSNEGETGWVSQSYANLS